MLEDVSKVKLHPGFRVIYRRGDPQIELFYKRHLLASWHTIYGWLPTFYEDVIDPNLCLLTEDCIEILNEYMLIQHNAQLAYRDNHGSITTGINCSRLT